MPKQKQDKKQSINQFVIYNIILTEAQNPKMFLKETDGSAVIDHAQEHFGSLLEGKKLTLKGKRRIKGEMQDILYPNDILSKHDDVYLLRINNRVMQNIVVQKGETNGVPNYEEDQVESNPYCYVVIDNRKDICQMAIQKNSAFGDPKNVRNILQENLAEYLGDLYPLDLELSMKVRPSKIWEFCQAQCGENGDAITRISFNFPNQKKINTNNRINKEHLKGILKEANKMVERTAALKMLISMDYSSVEPDVLEKNAEDFVQVIRECKDKSYNLSISFRDYGEYRCDDRVKAMFPMNEELINSFKTNFMNVPFEERFGLIDWCNYVREKSKIYENALQIPTRRHRKNKGTF